MFYDTPQRSLTGGTLRIDTNRINDVLGLDKRSLRFEVATGISDVRDLDRQMSAKQILVIHPDASVIKKIASIMENLQISVLEIDGLKDAYEKTLEIVTSYKLKNDPKAKASDPKAIIIDCDSNLEYSTDLIKKLKKRKRHILYSHHSHNARCKSISNGSHNHGGFNRTLSCKC